MTIIYTCPRCEQILIGTIGNLTCPDCGYTSKKYEPINLPVVDHSAWTIPQQVRKIGEEYGEVVEALLLGNPVEVIRESLDCMQTHWTLINMVAKEYGINIDKLYQEHCRKVGQERICEGGLIRLAINELIKAAEILEDMADVADVRGRASENRIGTVYINPEKSEHMREIASSLRQTYCKNIKYGSYDCYKPTGNGFDADRCLISEINNLNANGIKTIGCCCGHGKKEGYIQVTPEHLEKMFKLGYEQLPIDENKNGEWCFKPKTVFPIKDKELKEG